MDVVDEFMARYVREYDFYDQTGRIVRDKLERDLQEAGVRCILTSRAKSVSRLEAKCRQRNARQPYSSVEQIYEDIVDLAGVRVTLYFPGEKTVVGNRIEKLFHVLKTKSFPEESGLQPNSNRRFAGYFAQHYHVRLREEDLGEGDKRYATAKVEIQVASVLMHGWAEVDHDLVYKPQGETLSDEEHAILDQLNGLVMTGESLLESLQRARERRIAEDTRKFGSHYELAAHLLGQPTVVSDRPVTESGLGRMDLLFEFLTELGMETPAQLENYLDGLHGNLELRPLAEQVVDALMAEDSSRYDVYLNINMRQSSFDQEPPDLHAQVGRFLSSWINLEKLERELVPQSADVKRILPTGRELDRSGYLTADTRGEIEFLRRMRNQLVHGIETPPIGDLQLAADRLDAIVAEIRGRTASNPVQ